MNCACSAALQWRINWSGLMIHHDQYVKVLIYPPPSPPKTIAQLMIGCFMALKTVDLLLKVPDRSLQYSHLDIYIHIMNSPLFLNECKHNNVKFVVHASKLCGKLRPSRLVMHSSRNSVLIHVHVHAWVHNVEGLGTYVQCHNYA